ncbi:MAG: type II secretion system protein [Synergistaceae bacterium]|nr:type II secretion system protein [Synergistaceae bacterium]
MKNRKGFTLVEFLIVAAVVGVLSEMMLFTNIEAAHSAKANKIITNLQNIKFVTRAYYSASMDVYSPETDSDLPDKITKHVSKYLGSDSEELPNYYIKVDENSNNNSWWVCYNNVTDDIRDRLINKEGLKSESNTVALQIR